jgi:hypothetical protein
LSRQTWVILAEVGLALAIVALLLATLMPAIVGR